MPNFDKLKNQIEIKITPEGCESNCSNPPAARFSISETATQTRTVKNSWVCWPTNWGSCQTLMAGATVATGSSQLIDPTPPAG